jgi:hypothetical protein
MPEETNELGPRENRRMMVCPNFLACPVPPETMKHRQGHCKPHHEMETCSTSSKTCPPCVPYRKSGDF